MFEMGTCNNNSLRFDGKILPSNLIKIHLERVLSLLLKKNFWVNGLKPLTVKHEP